MKKVIIYGASYPDTVKIISAINKEFRTIEIFGFLDDVKYGKDQLFLNFPILGDRDSINKYAANYFFVNNVFGTVENRKKVTDLLKRQSVKFLSIVHPSVDITFSDIGQNVFIHDGVLIGAKSVLKDGAVVRFGSIINHDNEIEENVFIGPGVVLCGRVKIREGAYIGAGATITEDIVIGRYAKVGAGSVVIEDVKDYTTVIGVPAKQLKTTKNN